MVKNLPAVQEMRVGSLGWEDPLEKEMETHSSILPWNFCRQEYWSGLLFPYPRDLPDPEIELRSSAMQADSLPSEPAGKPSFIFN